MPKAALTAAVILNITLVVKVTNRFLLLLLLFFLSGFAALVYQVLWVRQLGLLFGNTAQASALTIAVFFAGLSMGGWFWGRRAPRGREALRWFGLIEIGVAVTALGHFLLIGLYHAAYPFMYDLIGHIRAVDMAVKILIAALVLFPPAFLMGGTLPLMSAHLIDDGGKLGRTGTVLYAVNTAGSAFGVIAAGFFLPVVFGFRVTYMLAVSIDLLVGVSTLLLSRSRQHLNDTEAFQPIQMRREEERDMAPLHPEIRHSAVWIIAFVSGFATLGVEVIWTRLFAQVLQNSVYTYAIVLTSFILALACGAALAHGLCRITSLNPRTAIATLLAAAAAATALAPWLFLERTDGLSYIGGSHAWAGYVMAVANVAAVVMFLPAVLLGTILPYLMRVLEQGEQATARKVGRLIAVDTLGAIFGSMSAGFLILPRLGAVRGLLLFSGVYLFGLTIFIMSGHHRFRIAVPAAAIVVFSIFIARDPLHLTTREVGSGSGGRVLEFREGVAANVAVVDLGDGLAIRVNNYYTLGSSRALQSERNQAVIPMLLHPDPQSVFFLGMGTGITAGASLSFPVTQVEVCEIIGDVIELARGHFRPYVNGLFDDSRVAIYAEDGRTCLSRSRTQYDVIISDLFTPWKAGTGNLYTLEHYRTASRRLKPGGLYAQWIPLYQVSFQEFGMIARTMMEVFPEVTLWRGDLFPSRSIVALIGSNQAGALDPEAIRNNFARNSAAAGNENTMADYSDAFLLRFYGGNVTESGAFDTYPLNTDTFPLVEYRAPRTHRAVQAGEERFMVGFERQTLYRDLLRALPPAYDPYLRNLSDAQHEYVRAGLDYTYYNLYTYLRRPDEASLFLGRYLERIPSSVSRRFSPAAELIPY